MKRIIYLLFSLTFSTAYLHAQAPQFAIVRPDGTTYICPTFDSAYLKAIDGDNIYLPGGTFTLSIIINKRLNIYGAGHHPDSTNATNRTTITNGISFSYGAQGGLLEGIQITADIVYSSSGRKINGYTIKRCRVNSISLQGSSVDSLPTNISLIENVVTDIIGTNDSQNPSNIYFSKNLIAGSVQYFTASNFTNNTFIYGGTSITGVTYSVFQNNIFVEPLVFTHNNTSCTNSFTNNLKINGCQILCGCPVNTGIEIGTINVPTANDIFVTFNGGYPYADNYHLKPTCSGINAGTDGTDVGIYGTSSPTPAGWVPSNPHIYFKQVADQTNNNGQLPIQFKVRTNN